MVRALIGALFLALCIVGPVRAQAPPSTVPCSPGHFLSVATTSGQVQQIAIGPHSLCGALVITSITATTAMDVRFYDTGSLSQGNCIVAAGGLPVIWNIPVPTNATNANVAGIVIPLPQDIFFQRGIGVCLTGAVTDTDGTTPAVGVQVNYGVR